MNSSEPELRRRNLSTALSLVALIAGMLMLTVASVPLYRLFCDITGFGGKPQRAAEAALAPTGPPGPPIMVRFNADISPSLPWRFQAPPPMRVRTGVRSLAHYEAHSLAAEPTLGTATYNVTPAGAAPYFVKIHCFCFEEQRLAAGQRVDMPVSYYVDPKIMDDPDLSGITTITLSYTFFPVKTKR